MSGKNIFLNALNRNVFIFVSIYTLCFGCTTSDVHKPSIAQTTNISQTMEEGVGIKVKSLRLSAAGNLVDLRYTVTDPVKASAFLKEKKNKPYLIDQDNGAVLSIPEMAKIGSMQSSPKNLVKGKVYFMMFANPPDFMKHGSKGTLVIGDYKIENLVVE